MLQQPAPAQLVDAGVQRVGRDAAHAVLQQSKGLRMAVTQRPQHAQRVAAFEFLEQLVDGGVFLGAHDASPCAMVWVSRREGPGRTEKQTFEIPAHLETLFRLLLQKKKLADSMILIDN